MITTGQHPEWKKNYQNYGLGMFVDEMGGKLLFAHDGGNYGYEMNFHCVPEKQYSRITLTNYVPYKYKSAFIRDARIFVKNK